MKFKKLSALLIAFVTLVYMLAFEVLAQEINDNWYQVELNYFTERAQLYYESDRFDPQTNVSRIEFIDMLAKAFSVHEIAQPDFDDVYFNADDKECLSLHLQWAYEHQLIFGCSPRIFKPDDPITREQAATIIGRLVEKGDLELRKSGYQEVAFLDHKDISGYAEKYVMLLAKEGILLGDENRQLLPQKSLTQAEAIALLGRLLMASEATQPPLENEQLKMVVYDIFLDGNAYSELETPSLTTIPSVSAGKYNLGWICLQNETEYSKVITEVNSYFSYLHLFLSAKNFKPLNHVPLDPIPRDRVFFDEHNILVFNIQSYRESDFKIESANYSIKGDTLYLFLKPMDANAMFANDESYVSEETSEATGYAIFFTVPKGCTNLEWALK